MQRCWSQVIALALVGWGGCSTLRIDVDVYKGPIVDSIDGRISKALGLARSIQAISAHSSLPGDSTENESLLKGLSQSFSDLKIEGLYSDYESARKNLGEKATTKPQSDNRNNEAQYLESIDDLQRARRPLLMALSAFGDHAQAVASRIAIPLLGHIERKLFIPSRDESEYLTALGTLDETGRVLTVVVNSIISEEKAPPNSKEVFLIRIKHVMASQAPGTVVATMENVKVAEKRIKRVFERRYWDRINPISNQLPGDAISILVKDETGNWHIKAAKADLSRTFDTARQILLNTLRTVLIAQGILSPTVAQ